MTISLVYKDNIKEQEIEKIKFDYKDITEFCKTKTFFNIFFISILIILFAFFIYMKKIYDIKNQTQSQEQEKIMPFIFPYNFHQ
jgi:hypothetical protein